MVIYWLLFAFPAIFALAYPAHHVRDTRASSQRLAMYLFALFYTLISGLRQDTGGDWLNYQDMFDAIEFGSLFDSFGATDPGYGALNWLSAQIGGGIYLVNAVCSLILVCGVVSTSRTLRDPWLAILIAVPYLLIVVGMGYVRQGAAIGFILLAVGSLNRAKSGATVLYILLAPLFHSSAVVVYPAFVWALFSRNRILGLVVSSVAVAVFLALLAPRLNTFQTGYIDSEYESQGALPRLLMGALPAIFVLARYRHVRAITRAGAVWLPFAIANVIALIVLFVSPSSTAVDRIGLFFATIQLFAFAEIRTLLGASDRMTLIVRLLLVGTAALVQLVWLVLAVNAASWVPYQSIFDAQ